MYAIRSYYVKRNDTRTIYNVIYYDGNSGNTMMKRAPVTGITRDKVYNIGRENKNSRIVYFSANPRITSYNVCYTKLLRISWGLSGLRAII